MVLVMSPPAPHYWGLCFSHWETNKDLALITLKLPSIQLCLVKTVSEFSTIHFSNDSSCLSSPARPLLCSVSDFSIQCNRLIPPLLRSLLSCSLTRGAGASTTSLRISALGGDSLTRFSFSTEISL